MLNPPSVNQITSAYTGHMPQLAQRVNDDKKANNGVPQDLRALMAENDMAKAMQNAQTQSALNQPQNPPTVAQSIHQHLQQMMQKQPQMQAQPPQGLPQGLPQVAPSQGMPEQGIDQLNANVGQSYAEGGIIGFDKGEEVPKAKEPSEEEVKAKRREADLEALLRLPKAALDLFQATL